MRRLSVSRAGGNTGLTHYQLEQFGITCASLSLN
jgi:hypothetical protein